MATRVSGFDCNHPYVTTSPGGQAEEHSFDGSIEVTHVLFGLHVDRSSPCRKLLTASGIGLQRAIDARWGSRRRPRTAASTRGTAGPGQDVLAVVHRVLSLQRWVLRFVRRRGPQDASARTRHGRLFHVEISAILIRFGRTSSAWRPQQRRTDDATPSRSCASIRRSQMRGGRWTHIQYSDSNPPLRRRRSDRHIALAPSSCTQIATARLLRRFATLPKRPCVS
jgi:hypothetical protein